MDDANDLWISGGEEEEGQDGPLDRTSFKLQLTYEGVSGDFHTRNKPDEKQRMKVTSRGAKRRSRFSIDATARAIVHGTLDQTSGKPATLLVYDFEFATHRSSARIMRADIDFLFQPGKGNSAGPLVAAVKPMGTHKMGDTEENNTRGLAAEGSLDAKIAGSGIGAKITPSRTTAKTTTHYTDVVGSTPANEYGDCLITRWSLVENSSQENGIPTFLRVVILLRRDDQAEFVCVPSIEVKVDRKSRLCAVLTSEAPDDPITFDPEYEPFIDEKEINVEIDPENLGAVDLDTLWDITLYNRFGQPIKPSKATDSVAREAAGSDKAT
ncbi:hypothetical protein KVR01_011726 [Diaporthe batatas]|uniref:uncharacterized protein n=1 Tax=Diaporthe batatas TaxID=748121 RepID=UPI001D053AC4|nr:uncharacterized protein KVR01_011726 [Diaporthe batatas]KAG8158604.1 hypothetical protein KVR01_011726 [Diaporthe batatas]